MTSREFNSEGPSIVRIDDSYIPSPHLKSIVLLLDFRGEPFSVTTHNHTESTKNRSLS